MSYTKDKKAKYGFPAGSRQATVMSNVELEFAKELLKKNSVILGCYPAAKINGNTTDMIIYDDIIPNKEKEEENSMNREKDYLNDLLETVYWDKRRALEKQYNLGVNPNPENFRELLDWVENKKYTINEKRAATIDARIAEGAPHFNVFDAIEWNGRPRPDNAGYSKAIDELNAKKTKIRSRIVVLGGEAALNEVESLEAWTPTVGNA